MSKKILVDLGNVRIKEYNSMNVVVERLEEVFIPQTEQKEKRWRFNGYSDDILDALEYINRKGLLIDEMQIRGLKDHLKQVHESNKKILNEIRRVKTC